MTLKNTNWLITFSACLFLLSACGGGSPNSGTNNPSGSSTSGASLTVSASLVSSGNLADSGIYSHMRSVYQDNISVSADGKAIYVSGGTASDSYSLLAKIDISVAGAPKVKKVINFNGELLQMVTSKNGKLAYTAHANIFRRGSWGTLAEVELLIENTVTYLSLKFQRWDTSADICKNT